MKKTSIDRLREIQIQCGYSPVSLEDVRKYTQQCIPSGIPRLLRNKFIKQAEQVLLKKYQQIPTEYQDPLTYSLLQGLFDEIKESAVHLSKDNQFTFPKSLTYGTANIGTFTAFVADFDAEKDYLLLISDGLFTFANLMAKSIGMLTIQPDSEDGKYLKFCFEENSIRSALKNNHDAIIRFADLIFAYTISNHPGYAKQYTPDLTLAAISGLLRHSFELFIIGHEYGHLLLNHLDITHPKVSDKKELIDTALNNWYEEISADTLGAYLAIGAMKGYDFVSSYAGVDICLITLTILERLENELKKKSSGYFTHPPGEFRREMVFQKLSETDPHIKDIYEANTYIVDELWNRCMYLLKELDSTMRNTLNMPITKIPYHVTQNILYRVGDHLLNSYDAENP